MRVLLTAPSCEGRLHNLVPMAWALRTAGHDVKIAGRPAFVNTINRTGAVAADLDGDGSTDPAWLDDPSAVDDLVDFAALWRPDVVVYDERALAGAVAASTSAGVRMVGASDQWFGGRMALYVDSRGQTRDGLLSEPYITRLPAASCPMIA